MDEHCVNCIYCHYDEMLDNYVCECPENDDSIMVNVIYDPYIEYCGEFEAVI